MAGMITPSDLQRVSVSKAVLSVILAAEAGMDQLILACCGSEGWLSCLSEVGSGGFREWRIGQEVRCKPPPEVEISTGQRAKGMR